MKDVHLKNDYEFENSDNEDGDNAFDAAIENDEEENDGEDGDNPNRMTE